MTKSARNQARAANSAFYAAFDGGDMKAMEAVWSSRDDISVFHPNAKGIRGRDSVMLSWRQILVNAEPPDITPMELALILSGKTAMVICEEDLGIARMIATNIFVDENGSWRLVHHQASPLPVVPDTSRKQDTDKGTRETK